MNELKLSLLNLSKSISELALSIEDPKTIGSMSNIISLINSVEICKQNITIAIASIETEIYQYLLDIKKEQTNHEICPCCDKRLPDHNGGTKPCAHCYETDKG